MSIRRVIGGVAAVGLALGSVVAAPSQAATLEGRNWVSASNGLVGTQQTIIVKASRSKGQIATITFENAAAGSNAGQAQVNSQGFAYLPWTPNLPGTWTISASVGGSTVDTAAITVVGMPTSTVLLTPGEVAENQTTTLVAQVKALGGSITPSGTITVRNQSNAVVATGTLSPTGTAGLASANISWTPSPGAVSLTATYNPATSAFNASSSPTQSPAVGGPQAVSLRLPPVSYVGVEETIAAVIQPAYQSPLGGSVGFSLNIDGFVFYPMGGSQPIGAGVGTVQWTPTQTGVQTVGVAYASANFAINGTDTQVINVQPAPTADVITLTPTGSPAWPAGNVWSLTQGNTVELTPTSVSGNPVTLATDGPCALDGAQLNALGPGQCTVTAKSLGNGGSLAAAESAYIISVQAPATKSR